jgi:hypothetical protein
VLDFDESTCYPLPTVYEIDEPVHVALFSADSTRLQLINDDGTVITLDTTRGMKNARRLPDTRAPFFEYADDDDDQYPKPHDERDNRVPSLIANDGTVAFNEVYSHFDDDGADDDADDDNNYPLTTHGPMQHMRTYAVYNATPGVSPIAAASSAVYFVANFTLPPVAVLDGQYLLAVLVTESAVEIQLLAVATGTLVSTASLPKPMELLRPKSQTFKLQLCALPSGFSSQAVVFVRGNAHAIAVRYNGGSPTNATLSVQVLGTATGVQPVYGCSNLNGHFLALVNFHQNSIMLLEESAAQHAH